MEKKLTMMAAIMLVASLVMAAPTAVSPVTVSHDGYSVDRDMVPLFCNMDYTSLTALSSQQDTAYPFESWVADDFMIDAGLSIDYIEFIGGFWNYSVFGQCDYFVVSIWEDQGNCLPPYPPVGAEVYTATVTDFDATLLEGDYYFYGADVPPFTPTPGVLYWISIQGGLFFDPNGQWGWCPGDIIWNCMSVQAFPLLGMEPWTIQGYNDILMCLYNGTTTATESSGRSSVKSLY